LIRGAFLPERLSYIKERNIREEALMCELKRRLIKKAKKKHCHIFPCALKKDLNACFSVVDDRLFFWYNTHDKSTHVVSARVKPSTRLKLPVAA
jgi:hypothetical protein